MIKDHRIMSTYIVFNLIIVASFITPTLFDTEILTIDSDADSTTTPLIWIEFLNDTITFEGDYGTDLVSVEGLVHYSFPYGYLSNDSCLVELEWQVDLEGINSMEVPEMVWLEDDIEGTEPFEIILFKDLQSHLISTSQVYALEVGGQWSMRNSSESGSIDPAIVDVKINPYCWFDSTYPEDEDLISGKIGDWKIIPITIINRGNSEMNITIGLDSEDDVEYTIDETEITIHEGEEYIVNLSVKQSKGWGKKNIITISLQGEAGESSDWECIGVPYITSNTIGSLLIVNWWIFILIFMFIILFIGGMVWKKKFRKKKD